MRTILVPVDFSSYSNNALDFAYELAKKAGDANIQIVHIIESMDVQAYNTMGMTDVDSQANMYMGLMIEGVHKQMESILNDSKYEGITIIPHVHQGKPYENISREIANHDADLVVMGTLGSTGLDELFIGSNTEKVVRYAKCQVLSIPTDAHFSNIKIVVFATNLKEDDDVIAKKLAVAQGFFDAHLHILWVNTHHVLRNEDEMKENLEQFAQRNGLKNYSTHVSKAIFPEAGIMNYGDEINADMIAMATGGKKGLSYLFSGSLAEDVVNHSCRPVWTFNVGKD
jgi:nucleotide-binding universal stress UspA family protein